MNKRLVATIFIYFRLFYSLQEALKSRTAGTAPNINAEELEIGIFRKKNLTRGPLSS